MREARKRMTSVFDGLQMLFRLTGGEIKREQVDVSDLAAEATQEQRAANPDNKAEVVIAPSITVNGDRRLVRVLVGNLIDNAWKFSALRPTPRIVVGQETVEGEPRVFIKDNGVGFD